MKGKDIIVVGLQPWDIKIGSNCKNIAAEFAKHNRVLYVNRAIDRIAYLRGKDDQSIARKNAISGKEKDLNEIQTNLWVLNPKVVLESINWIGNQRVFDFFNHINNERLAKVIDEASQRLGFVKPVVFIDNDFIRYVELPSLLKNKEGVIYYIRDFLNSQDYFKKHGKRLEPKLIKDADVVTANSAYLQEYAEQFRPKAWDIGQGCEFDFIPEGAIAKPADLEPIKGPVIGYTGAIVSMRLDEKLMLQLARENTSWNFVMVGPVDDVFRNSELNSLKNVWFLGTKKGSELPAYINYFDVCINPQVLNEMTIGNYPRKVDEYLAMGKPVVATRTKAMEMFKDFVYLCENAGEYQQAIRKALDDNQPIEQENRRKFALTHTWENSVNKLYNAYAAGK